VSNIFYAKALNFFCTAKNGQRTRAGWARPLAQMITAMKPSTLKSLRSFDSENLRFDELKKS